MRRGDDEFEGGIDINSILNDASLHDELISLGWTDMRPAAKTAAPPLTTNTPNKPTKPVKYAKEETIDIQADEVIVEPLDIGDYGIIDESNLQLTEDDLQDEGLLAEFEYISGGGDSTYEHETDEQHEANIQTVSNGISAITFDSTEPEQWKPVTKPTSKPLENKSSTTAAASSPNATGIPTVEEAKRNAVKFKREGNNAEALKWLRYAKQLEGNTLSTPDIPGTENVISATARSASFQQSGVKATSSAGAKAGQEANAKGQQQTAYEASYSHNSSAKAAMSGDAFAPLESAICEASKAALKEAKACEKSDTKQAVIKMREYKALQQELVVLQSRRQTPGASPALFHWQVRRYGSVKQTFYFRRSV